MAKDKNYVSIKFWIFAKMIMMIPCLNIPIMIILAFTGENESRKNYFKAELIWWVLVLIFMGILFAAGLAPVIYDFIQNQMSHAQPH